jgi:hypothetical protein
MFRDFSVYNIGISLSIVTAILYLIANIALQTRAKKRLEIKMRTHKKMLLEKFKEQNSRATAHTDDIEYEILLNLLRQEIGDLKEDTDKTVLKKTLDRKNYDNQKRYAYQIFSESGLIDSLEVNK